MKNKTLAVVIAAAFLLAAGSTHAAQSAFDYTGKNYGIMLDLGIGFTKGLDVKKELETSFDIKQSSGAVLRFGATGKIRIVQGLYVQPTFLVSFYSEKIDLKGIQVQTDQGVVTLRSLEWKTTHISFGVVPTYYFRLANSPVHPFAGLGIKLHSHSFGKATLKADEGEGKIDTDSKFGFGLGPMAGAEFILGPQMAIPVYFQFDMIFSKNVSDVFTIGTGFSMYF